MRKRLFVLTSMFTIKYSKINRSVDSTYQANVFKQKAVAFPTALKRFSTFYCFVLKG